MDDSCRAFAVEDNTTSEQLKATIVERIELKEDACFAIFEKKDGWERCLEPEEKPCELMGMWTDSNSKKRERREGVSQRRTICIHFQKEDILER